MMDENRIIKFPLQYTEIPKNKESDEPDILPFVDADNQNCSADRDVHNPNYAENSRKAGSKAKAEAKDKIRLRDIQLPDGLHLHVIKQYLTAALIAIITVVLLAVYKDAMYSVGFILTGVLAYMGIETTMDYAEGKITEVAVTCATVQHIFGRKTTRVVFRTDEEAPEYFEFIIPGKQIHKYVANYAYIIYFKANQPNILLGSTAL